MHERFFQLKSTMAYFPVQQNYNTTIVKAFKELWPFTLLNTSGNLYFRKWRRRTARPRLVQLTEHVWPFNIVQYALRELIDLAHFTENIRLSHAGDNLAFIGDALM